MQFKFAKKKKSALVSVVSFAFGNVLGTSTAFASLHISVSDLSILACSHPESTTHLGLFAEEDGQFWPVVKIFGGNPPFHNLCFSFLSLFPVQFEGSEKLLTAAEMVVSPPQHQPCPKNWPSMMVKSSPGIELGLDGERVDSALVLEKQP